MTGGSFMAARRRVAGVAAPIKARRNDVPILIANHVLMGAATTDPACGARSIAARFRFFHV
jgi:hypothetical protein